MQRLQNKTSAFAAFFLERLLFGVDFGWAADGFPSIFLGFLCWGWSIPSLDDPLLGPRGLGVSCGANVAAEKKPDDPLLV